MNTDKLLGCAIAFILLGWCSTAGAWQRPKVGEELPPLRKSASGEPKLLTPPLDASPVTETPEAPKDDAPLPLQPPAPAAVRRAAPEAPADASSNTRKSSVDIVGEGDGIRPATGNQPLRSIASSTLAQAATFRGVTPGKTKREELAVLWGEPKNQNKHGEHEELEFAIPPFHAVTATVENDVVASLTGRYETPITIENAAEALGVARFTPAVLRDECGKILGQTYPERGVLLGLTTHEDALRVTQAVIGPPAAEAFLTRAEQQRRQNPQASLLDVKSALELAPESDRAQALQLRLLLAADRVSEASTAAQAMLQEDSENIQARLGNGRASLKLARWREAEREARHVLDRTDIAQIDRATAKLLLGDVLAQSPQNDVRGAMVHHFAAAQAATTAVQETNPGTAQQEALETAIEAYLAIAKDLALGNWRRREESFAQWIGHAERVVEALAEADVKEDWLFLVRRRALEASAASGGKIEPAPYAATALETGSRLVAAATDPGRRAELQATLGESLLESSQSLMTAGKHAAGRNYIFDAQRLLEAANQHNTTPRIELLLGKAYFCRGLDQAVDKGNHADAVQWYAKALPLLDRPLTPGLSPRGAQGQRLVTMAVSMWATDERQQAVALTEKGLRYIQEAVDRAELDRSALAAPLSNLTNMNRQLGNEEKADQYQTRLVDFQTPAEEPKDDE